MPTHSLFALAVTIESSNLEDATQKAAHTGYLARMTIATADALQRCPSPDTFYDLARSFLTLRGYLWSAVAPSRTQHWLQELTADDLDNAAFALIYGCHTYNRYVKELGKNTNLAVSARDPQFGNNDLIRWMEAAWKLSKRV